MSNPLAKFRQHQKILLAVFGVGIIIAFVVLPNAMKMLDNQAGGGAGGNELALTWVEGDIDRAELSQMVQTYSALTQFLRDTADESQSQNGQPRARTLRPDLSQPVEIRAVQTMLRAKKAEQLGVVVSEEMVTKYIKDWADGVPKTEIIRLYKKAGMTEDQLYAILTRELMAQKLTIMASFGNQVGTPAQLYEYAGRLSRKAEFDLLPIQVASFIDRQDNPDPSDEQLRDFYKQWKVQVKYPGSPEPGLKEPFRASLEYLRADLGEFVEQAKAKVTEEEIQAYYDENKDVHYRVDTFGGFAIPLPPNPDPVLPLPRNPDPKQPSDDNAAPKPAGQFNVQDAAADDSKKAEDNDKTTAKTADPKKTTAAKKDDTKKDDNQNKDDPTPPAKQPGDEKPDVKKPEIKLPEVKYEPLSKHREDIREQLGREGAAAEIVRVFAEISQLESITTYREKYDDWQYSGPIDGDPIGDPPARPPLQEIGKKYGLSYGVTGMLSIFEADASEGFAKIFAAALQSRSAIPLLEVQSTADSKLAQLKSRRDAQLEGRLADLRPRGPYLTDAERNGYLCWKIKEKKSHVPDLSAIRKQAIDAWKMTQAREFARALAEEKAEQARTDGGKLRRAFKTEWAVQVIETDPFSWWTLTEEIRNIPFGNGQFFPMRTGRMIPNLNGKFDDRIKYINRQFLEKIFALEPTEVGVVFDHPQETVYVVRMNTIDPATPQQLLSQLNNARMVSNDESFIVRRDWDKALEEYFEVVWAPKQE
jgi:hypothetical protein